LREFVLLNIADDHDMKRALEILRAATDARLRELTDLDATIPARLRQSIQHSLLAPAKRIRAALVMISAKHWGAAPERAINAACAVEMVHAASLILDDLPAMDNAMLRRGLEANHKVFGEATAILSAIGLLSKAFGVISGDAGLTEPHRIAIINRLSAAIGPGGLVAGQELDLNGEAEKSTQPGIEAMYSGKTGALFAVAAEIGAIIGGADERGINAMADYGNRLGLAFQTLDDVLDAVADIDQAGKDVRKDVNRKTLVTLLGVADAERRAQFHLDAAVAAARHTGAGEPLCAFARYLNSAMQMKVFEAKRPAIVQ